MKNIANVLAVLGILVIVYSAIGKLIGQASINFGIVSVYPISGLIVGNSLMLIAILILIKSSCK